MQDLMFRPVGELAALVRGRQVSATELVASSLRAIEDANPNLGAFVDVDADGALAAAEAVGPDDPRPFAGVPIAIKTEVPVRGRVMNIGSRFLADHRPGHSAFLVQRLEEAGFIVVGITKMPEFGLLPTTEPRHLGPARNPWNPDYTPGGSSGGSAAAVAGGMVPLAHAADGGGSIRIPAACCGLFGLKPSRGRVSLGPDLGESFLTAHGVLSRTVADTALALDIMAGYEVGDANWAPRPAEPYSASMRRPPRKLRIAVSTANALEAPVDPECERGLRDAAELLSSLGHEVFEADPPLPGPESMATFIGAFAPQVSLGIAFGRVVNGRDPDEGDIEPLSRAIYDLSTNMSAVDYLATLAQLQALSRGVVAFFADCDVLMTPALAERPPRIGECTGHGAQPMEDFARSARFTPYAALFNITGQPAASVPVGFGPDGLPTAVQIAAAPLAEETLLRLAAQIEAARPWADARPDQAAAART